MAAIKQISERRRPKKKTAANLKKFPTGFLIGLLLFISMWAGLIYWLGAFLMVYIALYTTVIIFLAQTEAFVRGHWIKTKNAVVMHLGIFSLMLVLNYAASFWVLIGGALFSALAHYLVRRNLWLYSLLLGRDQFRAGHWVSRGKDSRYWASTLSFLTRRRYQNSIADILTEYIRTIDIEGTNTRKHLRSAVFEAWRKHRRDSGNERLDQSGFLQNNRRLSFQHFLRVISHFELMQWWFDLAQEKPEHIEILNDFFARFNEELATYMRAPKKLNVPALERSDLSNQIDTLLSKTNFPNQRLDEQVTYAYSMLYVVGGMARNF